MNLIKDTIIAECKEFEKYPYRGDDPNLQGMYNDVKAALTITQAAETILLPANTFGLIVEHAERFTDYDSSAVASPFDEVCFQITPPVSSDLLFKDDPDDHISAIILAQHNTGDPRKGRVFNAIVWYASRRLNRSMWFDLDKAVTEHVTPGIRLNPNETGAKTMIRNVAVSLCTLIASPGVEVTSVHPPRKVNIKRKKRNKPPLETYHVITLAETRKYENDPQSPHAKGRSHSYCYPVRRHLRTYKNGRTIWIAPHRRGLRHALDPSPQSGSRRAQSPSLR